MLPEHSEAIYKILDHLPAFRHPEPCCQTAEKPGPLLKDLRFSKASTTKSVQGTVCRAVWQLSPTNLKTADFDTFQTVQQPNVSRTAGAENCIAGKVNTEGVPQSSSSIVQNYKGGGWSMFSQ